MNWQIIGSTLAMFAVAACVACSNASGRPAQNSADVPPDRIVNFDVLYGQNCAGCHGVEGSGGAAMSLANPIFLAIADDDVIRHTAANGVPGTPMPAFAQSAGGMLTDKQIDSLVRGIRSWEKPNALRGTTAPSYAAPQASGDAQRGADVYRTYCSSCHGADGRGGSKASSIIDGAYLALVSDQQLRTIVIAGRPELGAPDWRGDVEGRPMSPQDISDVVAWLSSQRPKFPGQPYPTASINPADGESR
ncbi:MAG TPA: c-type cytochrome [Candidatus Polarisedimenticolia bacterium]|nr:c-type cytochrome [Candidatus Polarisedimenticolia bacterium]